MKGNDMTSQQNDSMEPGLTEELKEIQAVIQNVTWLNQKYEDDWRLLGKLLHQEANSRKWCDEYQEFVCKVNSLTTHLKMEFPVREYCVSWSTDVIVTVSGTKKITAFDSEDAALIFHDRADIEISHSDMIRAIDMGNWDCDDIDISINDIETIGPVQA